MYCLCSLFRRALSSTIATEPLRSIRNPATLPSIIHPNGTIPSGDFLSANRSTLPSGSEPSSLPLPYPYRATSQHLRICCSFPTERFRHTFPSTTCSCRVVVLHKPTSRPATPPPLPSYTAHILRKQRYSAAPAYLRPHFHARAAPSLRTFFRIPTHELTPLAHLRLHYHARAVPSLCTFVCITTHEPSRACAPPSSFLRTSSPTSTYFFNRFYVPVRQIIKRIYTNHLKYSYKSFKRVI